MSTFIESDHNRNHQSGRFQDKAGGRPTGSLAAIAADESVADWPELVRFANALPEGHTLRSDPDRLRAVVVNVLGGTAGATVAGAVEYFSARVPLGDPARLVADAVKLADQHGIRPAMAGDEDWPAGLTALGQDAPTALWVKGDLSLLSDPNQVVGFDGSRAATAYGEQVTADIAAESARAGKTILTAAAYGIDGAATRAALASDSRPAVFLQSGPDRPHPSGHTDLVHRVAALGVVFSEVPPGNPPTRVRMSRRRQVAAAVAGALVIPEASNRSGSLEAAAHATELGRPVFAVPGPITSAASSGANRLIAYGTARLVTSAQDVLDALH